MTTDRHGDGDRREDDVRVTARSDSGPEGSSPKSLPPPLASAGHKLECDATFSRAYNKSKSDRSVVTKRRRLLSAGQNRVIGVSKHSKNHPHSDCSPIQHIYLTLNRAVAEQTNGGKPHHHVYSPHHNSPLPPPTHPPPQPLLPLR